MLIQSRNGQLVAASEMSSLIRSLKDLWEQDIHLYAFAEAENRISIDEILRLMDVGPTPIPKTKVSSADRVIIKKRSNGKRGQDRHV